VAVVGAIVVVVVLVLLALLGAFTPPSSSHGPNETYSQARPAADSAAQGTSGGSWSLVIAAGISPSAPVTENVSSSSKDCNLTILPGGGSSVTIPAGPAGATGGTAPGWVFLYRDAAGELLFVSVINGTATSWATIAPGQECSTIFGLLSIIPSSAIDSSAAAAAVQGDASSFLAAHPSVSASYGLVGGVSFLGFHTGAEWEVNYTTCPLNAPSGTAGASFNATVNATTGAVVYQQTRPSILCRTGTSIGLASGAVPHPSFDPEAPLSLRGRTE